jgi:hypothetical protein
MVILHLRRLQRTFRTLALGRVVSAGGVVGAAPPLAAAIGPRADAVDSSRYS